MCVVLKPQACRDFLDVAETHSRRWQRALQYEKEQRHHLEETIEQLAKQHNSLERAWRENPTSYTGETHHLSLLSCLVEWKQCPLVASRNHVIMSCNHITKIWGLIFFVIVLFCYC